MDLLELEILLEIMQMEPLISQVNTDLGTWDWSEAERQVSWSSWEPRPALLCPGAISYSVTKLCLPHYQYIQLHFEILSSFSLKILKKHKNEKPKNKPQLLYRFSISNRANIPFKLTIILLIWFLCCYVGVPPGTCDAWQ